jgi:hypothetical protein
MPFPPARFQRTSLVYCASIAGVLLAAAIIVFGFHSAGSAMLAERPSSKAACRSPVWIRWKRHRTFNSLPAICRASAASDTLGK